jgi:hypothetical protein
MTYYLRSHPGPYPHTTLVESTQRQTEQADISRVGYDRVSPEYARQWVKDGGHHETPLWVDYDGKVRYARDAR